MDTEALKAELLAGHPVTGPYSGNDTAAAAEMNVKNVERIKETLTGNELFTSTAITEFALLTDTKKQMWVSWCNTHRDPAHASNISFVNHVFGTASITMAALAALRVEFISQAEYLGFGAMAAGYVQRARAG